MQPSRFAGPLHNRRTREPGSHPPPFQRDSSAKRRARQSRFLGTRHNVGNRASKAMHAKRYTRVKSRGPMIDRVKLCSWGEASRNSSTRVRRKRPAGRAKREKCAGRTSPGQRSVRRPDEQAVLGDDEVGAVLDRALRHQQIVHAVEHEAVAVAQIERAGTHGNLHGETSNAVLGG